MNAVLSLEAVACDGYRSACTRARISNRLCFDDFLFFFPLAALVSVFLEFPPNE